MQLSKARSANAAYMALPNLSTQLDYIKAAAAAIGQQIVEIRQGPRLQIRCLSAMAERGRLAGRIDGHYKLTLPAVRPDARRRDLGNLEKAVSDLSVSLGVIADDSRAEEISIAWLADGSDGITVRIELV